MNTHIVKLFVYFITIATSTWCITEQRLVTSDGREVILNDDGTWEFASQDRYATTPDGQQIQIKTDGSWTVVESTPPPAQTAQIADAPIPLVTKNDQPTNLVGNIEVASVQLSDAFVEEYKEKAGAQSKNVRTYRYINFILDVSLATSDQDSIGLKNFSPDDFVVTDNGGKRYDVISIEDTGISQPGRTAQLKVITNSAPSALSRVRDIALTISPNAFKTENTIVLNTNYRGLDRQNISKKY